MLCKSPVNGVVEWNCVMFLHQATLHLATMIDTTKYPANISQVGHMWPHVATSVFNMATSEMVSITHMVIVQRFIRTASSWYVLMLTAYMPQGPLAQCSILQAYHYISLIVNNIGNKHY